MSGAVRVTARNLRTLVGETVPFTTDDVGIPVLQKVLLETNDGDLVGTATDRFRVAVSRVRLYVDPDNPVPQGELQVAVHTNALKGLVQLFRPTRWNDPVLELRVDGPDLVVTCEQAGEWLSNAVVKVPAVSAEGYPDVRNLLKQCLADSERYEGVGAPRGYNPQLFASFKCAQRERTDVLVLHSPAAEGKPTVIECGEHFLGLIMARRRLGDAHGATEREEWTKRLDTMPPMPELPQLARKRTAAGRP